MSLVVIVSGLLNSINLINFFSWLGGTSLLNGSFYRIIMKDFEQTFFFSNSLSLYWKSENYREWKFMVMRNGVIDVHMMKFFQSMRYKMSEMFCPMWQRVHMNYAEKQQNCQNWFEHFFSSSFKDEAVKTYNWCPDESSLYLYEWMWIISLNNIIIYQSVEIALRTWSDEMARVISLFQNVSSATCFWQHQSVNGSER